MRPLSEVMKSMATLPVAGLLLLLALGSMAPAHAAELALLDDYVFTAEDAFGNVRSMALGRADLADPSGPTAFLLNPAAPLWPSSSLEVGHETYSYLDLLDMTDYAAAVSSSQVRLSLAYRREKPGADLIRAAPDEAAARRVADYRQTTTAIGVAWQPLAPSQADGGWSMTIGANWNHYDAGWDDESWTQDDWDAGLTARWVRRTPVGHYALSAAATVHNLYGRQLADIGRLPHHAAAGVALSGCLPVLDSHTGTLGWHLGYTHRQPLRPEDRDRYRADRLGLELVFADMLAVRLGDTYLGHTDEDDPEQTGRFGLGLRTPADLIGWLSVAVDWCEVDTGPTGKHSVWSFQGQLRY